MTTARLWIAAGLSLLGVAGVRLTGCGGGDTAVVAAGAGGASGGAGVGGRGGRAGAGGKAGKAGSAGQAGGGSWGGAAGQGGLASVGKDGWGIANWSTAGYMTISVGDIPPVNCGPGCKPIMASGHTNSLIDDFILHGDDLAVAGRGRRSILVVPRTGGETRVYGNYPGIGAYPIVAAVALSDTKISYILYFQPEGEEQRAELWVMDRETGAAHQVVTDKQEGWQYRGWGGNAMTETHVYMTLSSGLWSVELETGKLENIGGHDGCWYTMIRHGKFWCLDQDGGKPWVYDLATQQTSFLFPSPSKAFQAFASCTLDGKTCAWTDYRDPPGPGSSHSWYRGGEVYVRDMPSGTEERLTFDSPDAPLTKAFAAGNEDLAVWDQAEVVSMTGDSSVHIKNLVKLDRKTGKKCIYKGFLAGHGYLDGHKLITSKALQSGANWMVELDLDDPGIPWECW